ncbi:hypothetical protein V6N12_011750 [Hibiscus sabdariffa]|uniref:LysM domain-containing protein n=1 Tax=Hibiscus sabdariffa TaxID=183260 RepID=A0ABR2BTC1_9ROSI
MPFLAITRKLSLLFINHNMDVGHGKAKAFTPTCVSIYGQQEGDTCFSISQAFNLTVDAFLQLNPNLNCDKIFVGEWLCVNGFLT